MKVYAIVEAVLLSESIKIPQLATRQRLLPACHECKEGASIIVLYFTVRREAPGSRVSPSPAWL